MKRVTRAVLAGAAGTVALEAASYLDMAVRGRAASETPERIVAEVERRAGATELASSEPTQVHRRSGIGALLGYATGIGTTLVLSRLAMRRSMSVPVAGVVIGGAAMAVSDVGATALGVTDPRTWGPSGWMADLVPHLAYGMAAAAVLKATS
jgi:hypothetical protein